MLRIKNLPSTEKENSTEKKDDSIQKAKFYQIKPRPKLCHKRSQEIISVKKIDISNRDRIRITVRVKNTERVFTSNISLDEDEEEGFDKGMKLIWNSAKYPNNFFWPDILSLTRNSEIVCSNILVVSKYKSELPPYD